MYIFLYGFDFVCVVRKEEEKEKKKEIRLVFNYFCIFRFDFLIVFWNCWFDDGICYLGF